MIRVLLCVLLLIVIAIGAPSSALAESAGYLDALRKVIRTGGELADDVPVTSIRRGLDRPPPPDALTKLPDGDALRAALKLSDPGLLRQIEQLTPQEADLALRLFAAAKALTKASPDALARARAIEKGGSDLLFAVERHGDDMTTPAFRLLAAEDVGQLPAGALQKFSQTVATRGEPVLAAWKTYILPNWKKIAAAGLLADVVFNDGKWITTTGELTVEALKKLAKIGIEIVIGGAAEVGKQVVSSIWSTLLDKFGLWLLLVPLFGALPMAIWLSRLFKGWINTLRDIWRPAASTGTEPSKQTALPRRNRFGGNPASETKK